MTLIVGATAVDKVFFNGVELEKVYMNGVLVFESGNILTVGRQGTYDYGFANTEFSNFGSLSQTTFTGYDGSIDLLIWASAGNDPRATLLLSEAPYPGGVDVTVGDTVLDFRSATYEGVYVLNISQTVYNALPKSGAVKVKFEVVTF